MRYYQFEVLHIELSFFDLSKSALSLYFPRHNHFVGAPFSYGEPRCQKLEENLLTIYFCYTIKYDSLRFIAYLSARIS